MRTLFFCIFLLLSGCSILGDKFKPLENRPKDAAVIYVYRPYKFAAGAGKPDLVLDGNIISLIPNGSYQPVTVQKGKHTIEAKGSAFTSGPISFEAKLGKEYFLRTDLTMNKEIKNTARSVTYIGSEFFSDDNEIKTVIDQHDNEVQKEITNPSFMFIKESFARKDISETKLYTP